MYVSNAKINRPKVNISVRAWYTLIAVIPFLVSNTIGIPTFQEMTAATLITYAISIT